MTGPLGDRSWPDVAKGGLVLVPLGSTEQHGPHLPLSTDTVIARAVAERAAALLPGAAPVAPAIPYGASGEHAGFPGTVSLGGEALRAVLVEAVRSLVLWAGRVAFVNGHGGNGATLTAAVRALRREGHDVVWTACRVPGGDAHAGVTETSLMLHLAPELVLTERAVPGDRRPLSVLMPRLRTDGVRAVSPTGVLGDPTGASADQGLRTLRALASDVAGRLTAWRVDDTGRLLR
ncbi:mycofactocin biosynthesis peptidyl-dipeptidase MftE [Streptomyces griseoruber]|uniref:Mycofactocin system creatininase n=1 Tax=Streptomyces griseoruber TaxID=1943 RepID=A0A101SV65_9ACTN|nr:mycofactocin biosynthesis peptidyl-dipeptidase MftE [Streptomyces griseoruber]KUN80787.1 mycofactocin system creatininase [Streptomyces griseoruber]